MLIGKAGGLTRIQSGMDTVISGLGSIHSRSQKRDPSSLLGTGSGAPKVVVGAAPRDPGQPPVSCSGECRRVNAVPEADLGGLVTGPDPIYRFVALSRPDISHSRIRLCEVQLYELRGLDGCLGGSGGNASVHQKCLSRDVPA